VQRKLRRGIREVTTGETLRVRRPSPVTIAVFAIGFTLTASAVVAASHVDNSTEVRLLERQTRQAAAVLASSLALNQQVLDNALIVQSHNRQIDRTLFANAISPYVGNDRTFSAASIWRREGGRLVRSATMGATSRMGADAQQAFLARAFSAATTTVGMVGHGNRRRIAYALADPNTGHVIFAERTIPADGRSRFESNSAFADINYANYLGPRAERTAVTTANVDPTTLPLRGITATARVPFGDTVLTLVTSPRGHLGASLSQRLPFVLLAAGLLLTTLAFMVSRVLLRQRQTAEDSAAFAVGLSERLQRALLPFAIPPVPNLEVAVEYVAGTRGVDIGGDWYSFIALDSDHFAFVVGDVSGKGIDAVAVMARARFTLRAYLLRGDSPDVALSMSAPQFDVVDDGHIVTVVVGVGNWRTGEITLANAGHCQPLLLTGREPRYVEVATGPPLGAGPITYAPTSFAMNSGDTLFCYTDGLIERRNEAIDEGMGRLSMTIAASNGSVEDLVAHSVRSLRTDQAEDDIAVLAFRWTAEDSDEVTMR